MESAEIFSNYFNAQELSVWSFVIDIFIVAVLSSILGQVYVRYGNSLAHKKSLANNFVLLSITTMLVISVVKSSLALSLGLVGALSIVRFRAAIKEPEELTYLFLAISIGLGIGASQRYLTIVAFITIILIIAAKALLTKSNDLKSNLYISLTSKKPIKIDEIVPFLEETTANATLNRYEESKNKSELLFLVNFNSIDDLVLFKERVKKKYANMEITFFEDKGIFN